MRLHVLGLCQTQVTQHYTTCAFTSKVRELVKLMSPIDTVYLYSSGACDVAEHLEEHVQVGDVRGWFPDGFDPVLDKFSWDSEAPYWREFNQDCARELDKRVEHGDLVLSAVSTTNAAFHTVADRAQLVEWMIGYEGVGARSHWIFESYAWMHHVYGLNKIMNGRAYDDVVSGFRDPDDFEIGDDGGYLLYLGRMTERKGVHVASAIADRLNLPIIFAGPGASTPEYEHEIHCSDGTRAVGEYRGVVGADERRALLKGASCLIVPTLYIEPFGGVSVEALMSGVPVVASDWGVFPETITEDVGRRFRTLQEGCDAVEAVCDLPRGQALRDLAVARWSPQVVLPKYTAAFDRLGDLWGVGWAS